MVKTIISAREIHPAIILHSCQPARERGVKNVQFTIVIKISNYKCRSRQLHKMAPYLLYVSLNHTIIFDLFRREKGFKSKDKKPVKNERRKRVEKSGQGKKKGLKSY